MTMNTVLTEPLLDPQGNNDDELEQDEQAQLSDAADNDDDLQEDQVQISDDQDNDDPAITSVAMPRPRSNAFFLTTVSVATIPMFLFGFNTGVLNAPEGVIFPHHSRLQWSVAVSAFCVGGLLGANVSGFLADRWGRSTLMVTVFWINLVAGILHAMTPNIYGLILARLLVGVAGGASTVVTPTYLSEISPKDIRGSTGTLTQLACVMGILASILWELPFNSEHRWRWIFVPLPAMSCVGILAAPFYLVESPSWLLLQRRADSVGDRRQEALENLRKLRGYQRGQEDADGVIEMMLHEEMAASTGGSSSSRQSTTAVTVATASDVDADEDDPPEESHRVFAAYHSFRSYVLDPKNRIPIVSSILFPVAQQLSGINAVFYYSTSLFEGVIANPQTGTIIAFAVNAAATVGAVLLMDRWGRKTLLSLSAGGMFLCCILMTLSLEGSLPGMVTVIGVMLYICFFELGLGCIPFFLASEMIEPEFSGRVQSISMSCNWFSNFCVGLLFPYMDHFLRPFSFIPFAMVLLGTVLYAVFVLPETRGKTPAQVMQDLELRHGGHEPIPVVDDESEFAPRSDTRIV